MGLFARVLLACLLLSGACSGAPPGDVSAEAPQPTPAAPAPPPTPAVAQAAALARPRPAPTPTPPVPPTTWGDADEPVDALLDARFPLHGIAFHVQAEVHRRPAMDELPIGYLRRGAAFRAARAETGRGCRKGWYELATGGYVCQGEGVVIGAEPQRFEPAPAPPERFDALPYRYAKNVAHDALQFWRAPTDAEVTAVREVLAAMDATAEAGSTPATGETAAAGPDGDANAEREPGTDADGDPDSPALPEILRMRMEPGFYVSLDAGYPGPNDPPTPGYVRTVRGALVLEDALRDATEPLAPGLSLRDGTTLPVGFAFMKGVHAYRRDPITGARLEAGALERLSSLPLSTQTLELEGKPYRLALDGRLVRAHLLRVAELRARPSQIRRGARWIHVRLSSQTLVAYEGDRPVFTTLVSSGKEGHETPTGLFRVHTKHVSTTMDGMAGTDDAYSIEDVPWTIYFNGSYALHAAFWHDRFGIVRSHGCVNLAPADARWLFQWTTPEVPAGWHGAVAPADALGTYVLVEE